jgi:hypothetical protein
MDTQTGYTGRPARWASLAAPGRPRLGGVREQLGEYVPDEGVTLHVERQDQLGVTHGVGLPPGQPIQRAIATSAGQIDNEIRRLLKRCIVESTDTVRGATWTAATQEPKTRRAYR